MGYDEASASTRTAGERTDRKPIPRDGATHGAATLAIAEAVGAARDCDPTDLPPLHDYVDTDALDSLLAGARERAECVRLSFRYDGCEVTVESDASTSVWVSRTGSD